MGRPESRRREVARSAVEDAADADLHYVFVMTYGRSGSTLLQGVLNSVPGYVVRGENRGALYRLFQLHDAITAEQRKGDGTHRGEPVSPWFGLDEYRPDVAVRNIRAFVLDTLLRPPPGTRATGFKEVRWFYDDWREYLTFVQEVFPGAKFIINTRDRESVLKSKWWATTPTARDDLDRYENQLTDSAGLLGDRAFRLHYDEWSAEPETLRALFDWLGEPFDLDAIRAVLAVRHSY